MELNQQWILFKQYIRNTLDPEEYQGWLEELSLAEISQGRAVIAGIPHPVFQFDIKKNYDSLIRQLLMELFPEYAPFPKKQVEYHVGEYQSLKKEPVQAEFSFNQSPSTASIVGAPTTQRVPQNSMPSDRMNNIVRFPFKSIFDPKYTLESFVVGKNNRLAYKAGYLASQTPGIAYNPFVIYGKMGIGKTHLLEGIGHSIQSRHPHLKIVYATAENFLNDFITHVKSQRMALFRKRYREVDVLLLDDLHILGGAKQCQEEFMLTYPMRICLVTFIRLLFCCSSFIFSILELYNNRF